MLFSMAENIGGGGSVDIGGGGSVVSGGGGGWSMPGVTSGGSVYSAPSYSAPSYSAPAPSVSMPSLLADRIRGLFFGPYGEGTYTQLDYPVMPFLGPDKRLKRDDSGGGVVGGILQGDNLVPLAILALAAYILVK